MNDSMNAFELTDEQLDTVSGGSGFSFHGINVNVPINLDIAPTLNIAVLSKNIQQYGSLNDLKNVTSQSIK